MNAVIEKAKEFALNGLGYRLCVLQANSFEYLDGFVEAVKTAFPNPVEIMLVSISPALAVHTGQGALGIGIQCID